MCAVSSLNLTILDKYQLQSSAKVYVTEVELVYGKDPRPIRVTRHIQLVANRCQPPYREAPLVGRLRRKGMEIGTTLSHLMLRYWRHRSPKLLRQNPSMVAMATNFPYRCHLERTNERTCRPNLPTSIPYQETCYQFAVGWQVTSGDKHWPRRKRTLS